MCIFTKSKELLCADKDITCYKILYRHKGIYISPYYSTFTVKIGQRCKAEGEIHPVIAGEVYEIGKGLIHAYTNKKAAKTMAPIIVSSSSVCCNLVVVMKCVIPKGTLYTIGMYCSEIAAKEMIPKKLVYTKP